MTVPVVERSAPLPISNPFPVSEFRPIRNWHEWLKLWGAAETIQQMVGLLHCGFDVSIYPHKHGEPAYLPSDRIVFYLDVADGWNSMHYHGSDGPKFDMGTDTNGNAIFRSSGELKLLVAQKAYDILCAEFFSLRWNRIRMHSRIYGGLEEVFASDRLSTRLLDFFRIEKASGPYVKIHNYRGHRAHQEHSDKIVLDFLTAVAKLAWEENGGSRSPARQLKCDQMRPWSIEVLDCLGELESLRDKLTTMGDVSVAKLREVAMRARFYRMGEQTPVSSIPEAVLAGSTAARLLTERDVLIAEKARLASLEAAHRTRQEAERAIKSLGGQVGSDGGGVI